MHARSHFIYLQFMHLLFESHAAYGRVPPVDACQLSLVQFVVSLCSRR
jgi:hypothetical protein